MSAKKALILVVDDDIRMLRMMKRMLELENFQVLTANSGDAALKIIREGDSRSGPPRYHDAGYGRIYGMPAYPRVLSGPHNHGYRQGRR